VAERVAFVRTRCTSTCPSLLPGTRVGFDGLSYRMGGSDQLYGRVTKVTDGDTIQVQAQSRTTPVRPIGVNTPRPSPPTSP
jgi:endonuclease YncB( thermonuclease family)